MRTCIVVAILLATTANAAAQSASWQRNQRDNESLLAGTSSQVLMAPGASGLTAIQQGTRGSFVGGSGNVVNITQRNPSNSAEVIQGGPAPVAQVNQQGSANQALVIQLGRTTTASIQQNGASNAAGLGQLGNSNLGVIRQDGRANNAALIQFGLANAAALAQVGQINNSAVTQITPGGGAVDFIGAAAR